MPPGAGYAGTFTFKPETTFGSYLAPDHKWEVSTALVKPVRNRILGQGLDGKTVDSVSRLVESTRHGAGPVTGLVFNKKMLPLLKQIFGAASGPTQQASTAAYQTVFAMSDTATQDGLSFTGQIAMPELTGTVIPRTLLGTKIVSAELTCAVDNFLMLNLDLWCQDTNTSTTLAAVSSPSPLPKPFHWGQFTYKIGSASGSEAAVSGVRGFSVKIEWATRNDRSYAGTTPLSAEPIVNAKAQITGSIDADFIDTTIFEDRWNNKTQFAQVFLFTGANIESSYNETFQLALPTCVFSDGLDGLAGPDILTSGYPFQAYTDGTNAPATCTTMSVDTAL